MDKNGETLNKTAQATADPEAIYEAVDQALANLPLTAVAAQNGQQVTEQENLLEDFNDFIID